MRDTRGHEPRGGALARRLRQLRPPVIARILDEALLLDVRTVQPGEDELLLRAVVSACGRQGEAKEGASDD
jgi:seryl-tRNA(Sec) selenium transferase